MRYSIRGGLLAIAVLGVATCLLALYALGRPLAMADERRFERAKDAVQKEVQRLSESRPPTSESGAPTQIQIEGPMFGLRSGLLPRGARVDDVTPSLDDELATPLRSLVAKTAGTTTGTITASEERVTSGVAFVAAAPTTRGETAWAAYLMRPPRWTPILRTVGSALAVTSLGLVIAALFTVSRVQRGAASLVSTLDILGTKLDAPVPRPKVAELAAVADGIDSLAKRLAAAQHALAEKERLAVLGRVTAGVAHEVRNPLAAIKLRLEMALKSPTLAPALDEDLHCIAEEVDRLNRVVTDLMTIAGRRTGPQDELELDAFSRRRVSLLAPFLDDRGVKVTLTGRATITADGDALARVIDNLLRNAVEASGKGDVVVVEIAGETDGVVVLRVKDRGAGVPKERELELFEPFFTTKPEGVGLGLALSRAIANSHGGDLTYARSGDETMFELTLPRGEAT